MSGCRIVLLGREARSTRIVFHALKQEFGPLEVIIENPSSRLRLLANRVRRIGIVQTVGQVLFSLLVEPILRRAGRARMDAILREFGMDDSLLGEGGTRVESVNSDLTIRTLERLDPQVVVVNGTRIIKPRVLNCIKAPFINMHAGITPLYRGVHGAYWALAEGRGEWAGTTVHLVDSGIDTGAVLGRAMITPTKDDSFATYPLLQVGVGLPVLLRVIREAASGSLSRLEGLDLPSVLRHHPTIWDYLIRRWSKGVK